MRTVKSVKTSLLAACLTFGVSSANAQEEHRCMEHQHQFDVHSIQTIQEQSKNFNTWRKSIKKAGEKEYEIPVVVHVLYRTNAENISDAQIQSQIDVLNEDYNKQSDWQNTVSSFIGIVGDANITFKLATVDPWGNPTTGITRKQTTKTGFDYTANEAKKTSAGGVDPWDPDNYLNLWCVNDVTFQGIKNAVLGYAQFPGLDPATDGVVIRYEVFGRTGNLIPGYDGGRTATHEIGHWLGLKHLWGLDAQDGCNANDDDDISDTPLQGASSAGCPLTQTSCGSLDNVQNFMDYSDDACMTMFTLGQVEKIHYTLDNIRTNFTVANDNNYDVSVNSISNVNGLNCGGIYPSVNIQNRGLQTLSSVQLSVSIGGSEVYNQNHNINLNSGENISIELTGLPVAPGNDQTISVTATNPGGQTDEDPSNNTSSTTFDFELGQKIEFQIKESSLANTMNWTIDNTGGSVLNSNSINSTSANGLQSQTFCLEEDECYDFIVSEAFLEDLCSQYPSFNSATQYQAGDQFVYNGTIYEAKQLIWGSPPDTYAHFYNNLGSCPEVDGNDFYKIINKTTNEEIAQVKVSDYTSPETTNFCLALSTGKNEVNTPFVKVFPNPFSNSIQLSSKVELVRIFDTYGKLVAMVNNTNTISVSPDLSKGIYFIEIHEGNQIQKEIILKK